MKKSSTEVRPSSIVSKTIKINLLTRNKFTEKISVDIFWHYTIETLNLKTCLKKFFSQK